MRGSQWSSASRTSPSIWATVVASIVSKTKSCTPQPNSGRIGRSPLAVERIRWIAWSTSVSSDGERDAAAPVDLEREGDARAEDLCHDRSEPIRC